MMTTRRSFTLASLFVTSSDAPKSDVVAPFCPGHV